MTRFACLLLAIAAGPLLLAAPDNTNVVFRSDVSLVRVDVQVLDRQNRAITGLRQDDFVLREGNRVQPIRNFVSEAMPVDLLLLFDVSASMGPHVQRIANAAHDAFRVLGDKDRIAIMVFDRSSRVRLPFRSDRSEVERALNDMLRQETFHGGTDITRAMLDAADYIRRQGRKEARRAIVILTDDETEFDRADTAVERALQRADAVMSALIAPDAMAGRYGGGGYPTGQHGGGTWPGNGGGGIGGLGGIILGGGHGGYGRRGGNGGRMGGQRTKSAGTSQIALESGGDSMSVDNASALEDTLERLRQRYALHFLLPSGVQAGQERTIEVTLSQAARRRYPDADVHFRRTYISPSTTDNVATGTTAPAATSTVAVSEQPTMVKEAPAPAPKRRKMISEPEGPRVASTSASGTPASDDTAKDAVKPDASDLDSTQPRWRKLKPGEIPNQ